MMIKAIPSFLIILLVAIPFAARDDATDNLAPGESSPPRSFASIDELKRWGESRDTETGRKVTTLTISRDLFDFRQLSSP